MMNVTIRKETRRHISLEAYDLSRDRFQTTDSTPEDILCHKEEIYALYRAINTLNENQKRLIYRVFWLEESQYDIAREEGVSRVAIHNRLKKIFKKMKKILENEG
jgi:RNA polymerase sigma factor (sigma-70 family)